MKAGLLLTALLGMALGQSCPDPGVNGFASVSGTTTGGGNASPPITVTINSELRAAASASGARVIIVRGTINTNGAVPVSSHKTIRGQDASATIVGGFSMNRVENIILKNMNIRAGAAADTLASTYSHHIWYDHLNVYDATDGLSTSPASPTTRLSRGASSGIATRTPNTALLASSALGEARSLSMRESYASPSIITGGPRMSTSAHPA